MATILMSSTEFAQQMEKAGIPRAQADVIAKGLASMVVRNFDALVTKDYLDTRFGEFEARLGRDMDRQSTDVKQQVTGQASCMQLGFAEVNTRFARVNVMLVVIMAGVAVPVIQSLTALVGR